MAKLATIPVANKKPFRTESFQSAWADVVITIIAKMTAALRIRFLLFGFDLFSQALFSRIEMIGRNISKSSAAKQARQGFEPFVCIGGSCLGQHCVQGIDLILRDQLDDIRWHITRHGESLVLVQNLDGALWRRRGTGARPVFCGAAQKGFLPAFLLEVRPHERV